MFKKIWIGSRFGWIRNKSFRIHNTDNKGCIGNFAGKSDFVVSEIRPQIGVRYPTGHWKSGKSR